LKIIQKDLKHGIIKLSITNLDDLWALYNLIQIEDKIYAKTTREVKIENTGNTRARPSSRRVSVFTGITVEKIFFDKEVSRLRVHGKVINAPEDLNIQGKYHTLNLIVGSSLTIVKENWLKHQIKYLHDLTEKENPLIIVALDYDSCCIALSRIYGVDIKAEIPSKLPGKLEIEKRNLVLNEYFKTIVKIIEKTLIESKGKIVIVGPGFVKDLLFNYIKNNFKDLFSEIETVKSVGNGGISGVYEAVRVGIVNEVLKKVRIVRESAVVDEVFRRLGASTGNISYGVDDVAEDAVIGAVDTILVCDETLRKQEPDDRSKLEKVMKNVEDKGGKIIIISSEHEAGLKLKSLGGIAALLRYSKRY
jgi:protein pelota